MIIKLLEHSHIILMPQFTEFPEAVNLEKIFEIVQENTLKTDLFLGNKKFSLNQNVWRDHATMQQDILLHFWAIFSVLKSG